MKYIITGATSCIGAAVAKELLSQGHNVYAVIRKGSSREKFLMQSIPQKMQSNLNVVYCDFSHYEELPRIIDKVDVFINFAWVGTLRHERDDAEIQARNVEYAMKSMKAASAMGCKVYSEAGSQAEYGWKEELTAEESPCSPYSEYGKAKLKTWQEGSRVARELGMSYVHLRIFSVFGNGKTNDMISESMSKIHNNEPLLLTAGTQLWNMMNHTDAAIMITRVVNNVANDSKQVVETFNIASNDTRQLRDFITEMCNALDYKQQPQFGAIKAERLLSLNPSIDKTMKHIGKMEFKPFKQSIASYYKYLIDNDLSGGGKRSAH